MFKMQKHTILLITILLWSCVSVFAGEVRITHFLKDSYASGERTVKSSGENAAMFVNAEYAGGMTNTAKFSLYVSPYLVASQGGRYTKHIYIGSQRIVSKLGAQRLIGRGDLLVSIIGDYLTRVQCAFVDTPEVCRINDYIAAQQGYPIPYELPEPRGPYNDSGDGGFESGNSKPGKLDPLFHQVTEMIVNGGDWATISNIQRQFKIEYNRADRIMDQLVRIGIVGQPERAGKPRPVLVHTLEELDEIMTRFNILKK